MTNSKETEEQILEAARRKFHQNGYAGARMQAIADEAGINKSMLHYYFRSKDKLFHQIFQESVKRFFPIIFEVLNSDLELRPKVEKLIETYHHILRENPDLPQFVLYEMNQHPDRFKQFLESLGVEISPVFIKQIQEEVQAGSIRPIKPPVFIVNTIGLCLFPYIARNMIEVLFGMDEKQFEQFVEQRKKELSTFIFEGINR